MRKKTVYIVSYPRQSNLLCHGHPSISQITFLLLSAERKMNYCSGFTNCNAMSITAKCYPIKTANSQKERAQLKQVLGTKIDFGLLNTKPDALEPNLRVTPSSQLPPCLKREQQQKNNHESCPNAK